MDPEPPVAKYRAVSAAAFVSVLVGMDLFFSLLCSGFPLLFYLVLGGLGAWFGGRRYAWLSSETGRAKFVRRLGAGLALFSALGICVLCVKPVYWDTHCSWRYCSRAMGPGLLKSPFPVGTPTCSGWFVCANEYPFAPGEYASVLKRIEAQGCPAP